ncbi:hypothetical protein [Oerskovia enterophila]|uniref:hypothetical protein n=1 Tax=Oerskovia enterophila TaxID=43678 RepID=UPI003800F742
MSKYTLYFTNVTSTAVEVEADDLDSALELAYNRLPGSICAQCSGWGESWDRDEGEWEFDETAHYVDDIEVRS